MPYQIYLAGVCNTTGRELVSIEIVTLTESKLAENYIERMNADQDKPLNKSLFTTMLALKAYYGPTCEITFVYKKRLIE